jgi:hypothetical protein
LDIDGLARLNTAGVGTDTVARFGVSLRSCGGVASPGMSITYCFGAVVLT